MGAEAPYAELLLEVDGLILCPGRALLARLRPEVQPLTATVNLDGQITGITGADLTRPISYDV